MADFVEARTRAEFYEHSIDEWENSPEDLAETMEQCQPLASEVHRIYSEARDQICEELDEAECAERPAKKRIASLEALLESMPEEPEDGVRDWLISLRSKQFKTGIVPRIRSWFSEEPDWGEEFEYLPNDKTAQGAALSFFQDMDQESLDALGVTVVEGEHPGSSYYAAELRCEIEAANAAAEAAGLSVRFVRPQ